MPSSIVPIVQDKEHPVAQFTFRRVEDKDDAISLVYEDEVASTPKSQLQRIFAQFVN